MNKIDNVLKFIYQGDKVELQAEKIELANVKDLPKKLKSILDSQKKLDKSVPAYEKLGQEIKDQKGMLNMYVGDAESLLNDINTKAKDLGVDPNSFDGYKQLSIEVSNSKSEYLK